MCGGSSKRLERGLCRGVWHLQHDCHQSCWEAKVVEAADRVMASEHFRAVGRGGAKGRSSEEKFKL